ncbi:unnamed protein product [Oppiella nova]|uniref:N-terminal acetyltransferase B complex subunit MDM20 homolog n=1 Tax=Oppiella nova TaxID=334625 RepID=A0A7R9QEV6_9ACAR|nr:unnamed protein product [Oppiella nova]CAG2164368.1 unnamed protein product [Oppiella nova]
MDTRWTDCLDNGNNKKALQEADKVLKKQKDLVCAKVLKSLALLRLGRQEESLRLLQEVHSDSPTDDSTLQAMTICYRELHKIELIADAYEKALKKEPKNEELHSHLFMAYVRLSDYKKQQLAAINLYRLKPKNPYYFWAVMSVLMQAISAKDATIAQTVTLPLAEKMCKKFLDENKIEAEAEVELYILILEKQKKYNEMLALMDSPIGAKLSNHLDFLFKRRADLLRLLDRYEDAFEAYKQLIDNNLDQIDYYKEIISISFALNDKSGKDSNATQNHYLCLVMNFIDNCIEKSGISSALVDDNRADQPKPVPRLRGPYLAKMLLFGLLDKRQRTQGDVQQLLKQMTNSATDLLFEYFVEFGSKQAAIYDLFYALEEIHLTEEEVQTLILEMKQSISRISQDYKDLNSMHKLMTYHYVRHFLGQNDALSRDNRQKLVEHLNEMYENYYKNIILKSDVMPTEAQSTDPFVTLMACILFADNDLDDDMLSQTIILLEKSLIKTVGASHSLLESLDVKHIQYDSLGYVITTAMITGAHFTSSSQLLGNTLKFYSANFKDTLDYLISCYKFGSFTKVQEILSFRDRLNNSLQYCLSAVERMVLDLILETKNHDSTKDIINYMEIDVENDKFVWNEISDNRDFSVIRSNHQKSERLMKDNEKQTFADEILWLKIRNLIIRAIAASHNLASGKPEVSKEEFTNNNTKNGAETNGTVIRSNADMLRDLSLKFKEYISCVHSSKFADSLISIDGPNRAIAASHNLASGKPEVSKEEFTNNNTKNGAETNGTVIRSNADMLRDLSLKFKEYMSCVHSSKFADSLISIDGPNRSRIVLFKESLLTDIKSGDIFAIIVDKLEEVVKNTKTLFCIQSTLEQLTNAIETLSIAIIFLGFCQSIMKSSLNINSNKKNRRKKETSGSAEETTSGLVKTYDSLISKFEESAQRIDTILKSLNISSVFDERFASNQSMRWLLLTSVAIGIGGQISVTKRSA